MRTSIQYLGLLVVLGLASCAQVAGLGETPVDEAQVPIKPELFVDFESAEGIGFSQSGQLYVAANKSVWRVSDKGEKFRLTDVDSNLGIHRIGDRDILMADFGPTVALRPGAKNDGVIWRISPNGKKVKFAKGIADPNAILILDDGTILASDDFTHNIYQITRDGQVSVWSNAVPFPNGMALSADGQTLYVAQIFVQIEERPITFADAIWAIPLREGKPAGPAKVVARTGGKGGVDGLASDELGRIYIAENQGGNVWRYDPMSEQLTLISEGLPNVASLVFGEGEFDHHTIYATTTFSGGGSVWKIPVGVKGRSVNH